MWITDGPLSYTDTNECLYANGGCQQICNNTIGSFNCSCDIGYSLMPDGFNCSGKDIVFGFNIGSILHIQPPDINECNGNNSCSLNANCSNTYGSYTCSCHVGFEGDGINCTSG